MDANRRLDGSLLPVFKRLHGRFNLERPAVRIGQGRKITVVPDGGVVRDLRLRPRPPLGEGGADREFALVNGMPYGEFAGEEGYLPLGKGGRSSVADVSEDWISRVSHLEPDLVLSSGFQEDFHEASGPGHIQHSVEKPRFAAEGCFRGNDPAGPVFAPFHLVDEPSRCLLLNTFDHGKITLANNSGPELFADPRCCFGCPAKENNAGNGPVQPVYHAEEHLPGLLIFVLQPRFSKFQKGCLARFVSLNEKTRWFI